MAVKKNLTKAIIGDNLSIPLRFQEDGNPIDITGRTFYLTLKLNPAVDDSEADAQFMVVAPATQASIDGEVILSLSAAQTESLLATSYNYDVQMITPIPGSDDEVKTIVYGRITFIQQITRSR